MEYFQFVGRQWNTFYNLFIDSITIKFKSNDTTPPTVTVPTETQLYGSSYYDTERGLFDIRAIYYTNEMEAGYAFGVEYETLQIDGFPDYSIYAEFAGLFTAPDFTQTYAMLNIDSGEDLNEVRIAVSSKLTAQEIFDGIRGGTLDCETVASGEGQEARVPVFGDGLHIAVAVGYFNDEPVSNYVLRFNVGAGTTVPNDP